MQVRITVSTSVREEMFVISDLMGHLAGPLEAMGGDISATYTNDGAATSMVTPDIAVINVYRFASELLRWFGSTAARVEDK